MDEYKVGTENTTQVESQSSKKKAPLNKYALACALLASTNSILLGYGESSLFYIQYPYFSHVVVQSFDLIFVLHYSMRS